jgi:anti-sigma-K factor RskA
VSHTDPERLALMALGEPGADDGHAAGCPQCQAELGQLTSVVRVARGTPEPVRLKAPPAGLWSRIAAESNVPVDEAGGAVGIGETGGVRWGRTRRRAVLAAALIVAAAVGAGIWGGVDALTSPQTTVVGQAALKPLPEFPQWSTASGTAVMATGPHGQQVTVTLDAPDRAGFYEVWLLARDGHSMISLGDLGSGHTGTFDMPPGVDLSNYSRLDVSLQAYNGSTAHAKASVVRGALPVSR